MAASISHGLARVAITVHEGRPGDRLLAPSTGVCVTLPTHVGLDGVDRQMWYLIEDFFEQGFIAKLFIAVGWLAVLIMVASFVDSLLP